MVFCNRKVTNTVFRGLLLDSSWRLIFILTLLDLESTEIHLWVCLRVSTKVSLKEKNPSLLCMAWSHRQDEWKREKGERQLGTSIHLSLLPGCGYNVTNCLIFFCCHTYPAMTDYNVSQNKAFLLCLLKKKYINSVTMKITNTDGKYPCYP